MTTHGRVEPVHGQMSKPRMIVIMTEMPKRLAA